MTRVYASAGLDDLMRLAAGESVVLETNQAESEDEEHEFEALLAAQERGPVVVTAEITSSDNSMKLEDVESLHLDTDDSGELSWFARQELIHVIEILKSEEY
ncbi:MAG: hypothetical protein GX678_01885 [Actinomycetales bacterium]|nr:hypothetical protein [Actinomycetales bacterium]